MRQSMENSIRVRFDHQETGWAAPAGPRLAVIENIPLTHRCNLGDLVRLEAEGEDGLPWAGEIVHRRFAAKTILFYYGLADLQMLCGLFKLLGCETEGARGPVDLAPGVLLVAHDRRIRPDLLAGAAGVPQPLGTPTRVALKGGSLVAEPDELRLETSDGSEVVGWRKADWTESPGVAVQVLDTLHRCVCRGVDEAISPAASSAMAGPGRQSSRERLGPRPVKAAFRRWRYLD